MTARGIKVNDANASYLEITGLSVNLTTTDFVLTGWMRIKGNNGNDRGQCPFAIKDDTVGGQASFRDNTFDGTSPWSMNGFDTDLTTSNNSTGTWAPLTDEDWFYAMVWDHSTTKWTYFAAKDQDASLTSATDASSTTNTTLERIRVAAQFFGSYSNNIECTNVKAWSGAAIAGTFDATALFAEMNSEDPVISSGIYAHWKLLSAAGLTDSSGNGRTIAATGTVTDGTMDPVDLQTAAGATCTFYGRLIA